MDYPLSRGSPAIVTLLGSPGGVPGKVVFLGVAHSCEILGGGSREPLSPSLSPSREAVWSLDFSNMEAREIDMFGLVELLPTPSSPESPDLGSTRHLSLLTVR